MENILAGTIHYDFNDLKIKTDQIERFMGYKNGEAHEHVAELVDEVLKECSSLSDVRAEYRIFENIKFYESEKLVEIMNNHFHINKIVFGQLKKSDSIAIFLCTAGPGIGARSRELIAGGDLLRGYIYDATGSEIVETAAGLMQDDLERRMSDEGRKITNRFSPGYCGWDVSEQHKLFSLMPYNYCGIRLTPSSLMDPVKSVSGFIGIGEKVKRAPYTCSFCEMKDCIHRKTRS